MNMTRGRKVLFDDDHDELGEDIVMDLFELTPAKISKKLNCNTIAIMDPRPTIYRQRCNKERL